MKILGLDVSSTTIGVALLDCNSKKATLVVGSYYKPPKGKRTIYERLSETKASVKKWVDGYQPDFIVIEDILLYMGGKKGRRKSNAQTITTLAIWNRMVGLTSFEASGKNPYLLSVEEIRKILKLDKHIPKKEEMPELVAKHLGMDFPWVKYYNIKKKLANRKENFDIADAVAVALAFYKKGMNDDGFAGFPGFRN